LSFEDRAGHLPNLIVDLIYRLRLPQRESAAISIPARQHGDLRRQQGYTAAMVVEESRILQVSIFNTVQNNLDRVDFSNVLRDVITIADEVDSQLKQAVLSYSEPGRAACRRPRARELKACSITFKYMPSVADVLKVKPPEKPPRTTSAKRKATTR
jgi:hypothetical protein